MHGHSKLRNRAIANVFSQMGLVESWGTGIKKIIDSAKEYGISFPLISSGIFGGLLDNPVAESTKQCLRAYKKYTADYPEYDIDVKLCAFMASEMKEAENEYEAFKQAN